VVDFEIKPGLKNQHLDANQADVTGFPVDQGNLTQLPYSTKFIRIKL